MLSLFSRSPTPPADANAQAWADLARTNPEQLHSLALNNPAEEIRLAAVQFVEDPKILVKVARTDCSMRTRAVAIGRITDVDQRLALIADPMLPEEVRRMALVGMTPDPRLLALYRPEAPALFRGALINALGGLQDDKFWIDVARRDPSPKIRARAMGQIKDERAYVELYRSEPDPELQRMLTEFVTTPELLRQLSEIQRTESERMRVIGRIQDESVLAQIVIADRSPALGLELLDQIKNPTLVREIAQSKTPFPVAMRALARVGDDKARAKVAMHSPHEDIRAEALRLITDEDVLDRLETEAPRPEIRWLAGRRVGSMPLKALDEIDNGKTLRRLIEQEQEPDVATWLVNRVNDQDTLRVLGGTAFPGTKAAQRRLGEREGPLGLRFLQVPGRPYEMGVFPVTIAQLREALGPEAGGKGDPRLPATKVTPEEAVKFCEFLTKKGGGVYRLPSYEEWWHACLADDENWLDAQTGQFSWAEALVGTRRLAYGCEGRRAAPAAWANPWGFLDMVGNVAVWVDDPLRYWMHLAGDDPLATGGNYSNESSFGAAAGVCWSDGKVDKQRLRRVVARNALSGWASDKVGIRVVCDRETPKSATRYKVTLLSQLAPGQTKEGATLMISSLWSAAANRIATWYRVAPVVVLTSATYTEARSLKRLLESCGAVVQVSPV